jgi:uncharacterized protein YecE (DUF72 family)
VPGCTGENSCYAEEMATGARAFIGTSGWNYPEWRTGFYRGIPQKRWLEHAAQTFDALEINGSFYREPAPATYLDWARRTPPGFVFALKGHRYVTHWRRLAAAAGSITRLRDGARLLGSKLAVVLWQLPDDLSCDLLRLDGFLAALETWDDCRHAIEFRHRSWFTDAVAARLRARGVAVVISDAPGIPLWDTATTDLVYVRLHGHTRKYVSSYRRDALLRWTRRVREWRDAGCTVHLYFDNTASGAAVVNALTLMELVHGRAARATTGAQHQVRGA